MRSVYLAIAMTVTVGVSNATAQNQADVITLGEVLPALADTELGSIEVGPAPLPGTTRSVRRGEILAALERAGRSSEGLLIPGSVRVSRASRELSEAAIEELALPAVQETLAPCTVSSLRISHGISVSDGPLQVTADGDPPYRGTSAAVTLLFTSRGREVRLPIRAEVTCPSPEIAPGDQVQLVVRVGNVYATAPGEARQPGRIGEVIRVANTSTRASLEGRVLSRDRVEVIQ